MFSLTSTRRNFRRYGPLEMLLLGGRRNWRRSRYLTVSRSGGTEPKTKMRLAAISVWMFVNTMFLGMWCYVYILWAQYWKYAENHAPERKQRSSVARGGRASGFGGFWTDDAAFSAIQTAEEVKTFPLQFANEFIDSNVDDRPGNESDHQKRRTRAYKTQLLIQLRNALLQEARDKANRYQVHYKGPRLKLTDRKSVADLMCEFKNEVRLRTLRPADEPFKTTGMGKFFPSTSYLQGERFNTCAVVTNAGSLLGSKLGPEIDMHDAVLRFNHAPTAGYEADIGTKTTFRVINSQIVSKPKFDFLNSPLYQNVSLLAWDPPKYKGSLYEWYLSPEYDIFTHYFQRRIMDPEASIYLLHPGVVWELWNFLQKNSPSRILRNPPSSGFLGIVAMLHHCNWVDIYEYIPSLRTTPRCYYFDTMEELGCTFGGWHPLATEKLMVLAMNSAPDDDVYLRGKVRLKGFEQLNCAPPG